MVRSRYGVYESLLDGMELEELREHEGVDVKHYLIVDAYYTWWTCGKSYLCRIVDMLHMGYVDEVIFGREVLTTSDSRFRVGPACSPPGKCASNCRCGRRTNAGGRSWLKPILIYLLTCSAMVAVSDCCKRLRPAYGALQPMRLSIRNEEDVNAATHALGLIAGATASAIVVWAAVAHGSVGQILGCTVYAITLISAYAASTLSHVFRTPRLSHAFRIADQAIIFLLIAGTYTPVAVTYLRGGYWWALHCLIWGIALFGFITKVGFGHRVELGAVSITLYVLLAWLPVLFTPFLIRVMPNRLLLWMLAGGLAYMAGTLFFMYDHRIRYFHAAWHLMVIAGSFCHFIGILLYCTGARPII